MKTVTHEEIQDHFMQFLDLVQHGEEIMIQNEHDHQNVAVIIPYNIYQHRRKRPVGILKGKACCTIKEDFAISDEELLTV